MTSSLHGRTPRHTRPSTCRDTTTSDDVHIVLHILSRVGRLDCRFQNNADDMTMDHPAIYPAVVAAGIAAATWPLVSEDPKSPDGYPFNLPMRRPRRASYLTTIMLPHHASGPGIDCHGNRYHGLTTTTHTVHEIPTNTVAETVSTTTVAVQPALIFCGEVAHVAVVPTSTDDRHRPMTPTERTTTNLTARSTVRLSAS